MIKIKFDRNNNSCKKVLSLKEFLEEQEKIAIEKTLLLYNGDKKETMKALNISKTTLYDKLKIYNIR